MKTSNFSIAINDNEIFFIQAMLSMVDVPK